MAITSLRITDFRNLAALELTPCTRGLNIVCGHNGSGKTSLLEAIYYLSLGRSFRSALPARLIRHETDKFSLFAHLVSDGERHIPVGVERDTCGTVRLRIAEKDTTRLTELVSLLPVQIINSQSHHLFESGPVFRRKYMDWGLFYHSEHFLTCWRHYERSLKQRNAILREKRPKNELDAWTDELVKHGLDLDALRRDYIDVLRPVVSELANELLGIPDITLNYASGWDTNHDYKSVLKSHYLEEYRLGCTQYGPHRADLDIQLSTGSVKHFLSRGQQKLLICAMILAQGNLLARQTNKGLIYLVDDLPSELDLQSRQKLISLLSRQPTQIFITAIEHEEVMDGLVNLDVPMKVFHVKHGHVDEWLSA